MKKGKTMAVHSLKQSKEKEVPFAPVKTVQRSIKTKAFSLLDKFEEQESVGKETKQRVIRNPRMEELEKLFLGKLKYCIPLLGDVPEIRNFGPTSSEISEFVLSVLPKYGGDCYSFPAGIFISKLVKESKDKDFTISIDHLPYIIDNLGLENDKNLTINGNIGHCAGGMVRHGKLTINGNIGKLAQELPGLPFRKIPFAINYFLSFFIFSSGDIYQYDRQIVRNGLQISEIENK